MDKEFALEELACWLLLPQQWVILLTLLVMPVKRRQRQQALVLMPVMLRLKPQVQ